MVKTAMAEWPSEQQEVREEENTFEELVILLGEPDELWKFGTD